MGFDFANGYFTCPKCRYDVFKCYPQTVDVNARINTWEYTCAKCGKAVAIRVMDWHAKGDE